MTIKWRELKELVEKEAMGREVDEFVVDCMLGLGSAPTSVVVSSEQATITLCGEQDDTEVQCPDCGREFFA